MCKSFAKFEFFLNSVLRVLELLQDIRIVAMLELYCQGSNLPLRVQFVEAYCNRYCHFLLILKLGDLRTEVYS